MAKYSYSASRTQIDLIFYALSDPTRRDILLRLAAGDLTVSEIAKSYKFSLPTISKHLSVLLRAQLIHKEKVGRVYYVSFEPETMKIASDYLSRFKKFWTFRFGDLEKLFHPEKNG